MTDLDKQIAAVNQAIYQQMKKASYRVVVSVALLILNKSIPKAPVDTGHLRNSSVVIASRGGAAFYSQKRHKVIRIWDKPAEEELLTGLRGFVTGYPEPQAVVAFIASYALHVHEGDPSWNWNDGGPKYLERGVNESIPLVHMVGTNAITNTGTLEGPKVLDNDASTALGAGTGDNI